MADNLTLPASGTTIATDDVGGVAYQRVKATFGTDGTATDVSASNPLPVTKSDCVNLLSTTITVPGTSSSMDTLGYGAVVVQISGVWNGMAYFEASNDGTNWDMVLVFSRDSLSLQDMVTSGGLYTIRPSGRYLRLAVPNITGSMAVSALGRAAEGISAVDLLSLAMDRANNAPLFTELADASLAALAPAQPLKQVAAITMVGVVPVNTVLGIFEVSGYKSLNITSNVGTTGVVTPYWSNDGVNYVAGTTFDPAGTGSATIPAGASHRVVNVLGRYLRLTMTTATTAGNTTVTILGSQATMSTTPTTQVVSFTQPALVAGTAAVGDFGIQYRASATGAATVSKFTAAATTNAGTAKASPGRLLGWWLANTTASMKYFRFFNLAVAPTMGTSSPYFVVPIAANSVAYAEFPGGIAFSTGIAIACTGAVADLDTTATAANDVIGALFYA